MSADPEGALPVLIADDDESLRRLYVRALERAGFATREAKDGLEALERIESEEIGLVLLDIHMPGLDGVSIVERVRADERTRTLPVILLSARAGEEARVEGLASGADDYLVKPFSARELQARVAPGLSIEDTTPLPSPAMPSDHAPVLVWFEIPSRGEGDP
jgi:DNA-binding response OmpR family regulator